MNKMKTMTLRQIVMGDVKHVKNPTKSEPRLGEDVSIIQFGAFISVNGPSSIFSFVESASGNGSQQNQFNRRFSGENDFQEFRRSLFGFYLDSTIGNLGLWDIDNRKFFTAVEEYQQWCVSNPANMKTIRNTASINLWVRSKYEKSGSAKEAFVDHDQNGLADFGI